MSNAQSTKKSGCFAAPGGEPVQCTAEVDALVHEVIGRIADKWTMLVLEALAEHEVLRFTRLAEAVGDVSQKMLTKTLRQMERDGFVTRTVHPEVPPRVEYRLTDLGRSLGEAFCGVWHWAEANHEAVERARATYARNRARERAGTEPGAQRPAGT